MAEPRGRAGRRRTRIWVLRRKTWRRRARERIAAIGAFRPHLPRRRAGRRRLSRLGLARRIALIGGGAIAAFLLVDGVWAGATAARGLADTREALRGAAVHLLAGRLDAADATFGEARADAESAVRFSSHPAVAVARILPFIGDDVRAIDALGEASLLLARTGEQIVRGAGALGWDGEGIPGFRSGGDVRIERIRGAAPSLQAASELASQALTILGEAPHDGLIGPVASALAAARAEVTDRAALLGKASDLARLLPAFLGGDGSRRYFLAIQNLSAPRGTGGYLGSYGILTADDGRVTLRRLDPAGRVPPTEPVSAPDDVRRRYGRFGGLTHLIAANYSPDFPTAARVLTKMYERASGERVDGVIAVDSVWMSYLLDVIGPVRVGGEPAAGAGAGAKAGGGGPSPGPEKDAAAAGIPKLAPEEEPLQAEPVLDSTITAANVSRVLGRDTFLLPERESERAQQQLGLALWRSLLERPLPLRGLGEAMDRATRERHLQIYATDAREQSVLGELGVTGAVRLERNPLFVVWQDATASRTGYFARKAVSHDVRLGADGSAIVVTEITLENRAPEGPPSILLGEAATGDPVGSYTAFVNVYLPPGATDVASENADAAPFELLEEEFGHPVLMGMLGALPGERATLRVSYRIPAAASPVGEAMSFRAGLLPQPALRPDEVSVDITLPGGAELASASGLTGTGPTVSYRGTPTVARLLSLEYVPA